MHSTDLGTTWTNYGTMTSSASGILGLSGTWNNQGTINASATTNLGGTWSNFGTVTITGGKMDDVMKEKIENDTAALMRSVVSKRGRIIEVAESAVRQSKSFTDQEALSQKLIDYIASSEQDLFKDIQGKPFKRFSGETANMNLVGQPIRT